MKRACLVAALLLIACGHRSLTDPDGGDVRLVSALGFRVEATREYLGNGGTVTQQHADLADRWWTSLMADLKRGGFSNAQTDPSRHVQWVFVYLHQPVGSDSNIRCPGWSVPVGGCYDQFKPAFRVPGDYIDPDGWLGARPASQPLKHEMTHHWCFRTFGHMCMTGEEHRWAMPNGVNIWDVQWYDGYPPTAASALTIASERAFRCSVSEEH